MKYSKIIIFSAVVAGLLLITSAAVNAQSKEPRNRKSPKKTEADNSFKPYTPETEFEPSEQSESRQKKRKTRKKDQKNTFRYDFLKSLDQKKEEFYKRIKENAKEDRKMERKMRKPQYSDPMYFGHKRKPKKRPVGKRKFCKECGIVH